MSRRPNAEVSIIVIGHSVRGELECCFASIEKHAAVPCQVIYVDNASTDGTAEWVSARHPEIELIQLSENIGAAARAHAFRNARGRFTMFLDSDAELTPGALPSMREAMSAHPDWGLLGPRLTYENGNLQYSCRRFPPLILPLLRRPPLKRYFDDHRIVRHHLMTDIDHTRTCFVPYVIGACQLFRTDLGRAIGPYDERVFLGASDIDWCFRCWRADRPVVYFPRATVVHRYRRLTTSNPWSRAAIGQLTAFARLQWKYRDRRFRRGMAGIGGQTPQDDPLAGLRPLDH